MTKEEKIRHLNFIKSKLDFIKADERGIDRISELIHSELKNELAQSDRNHTYVSYLRQTISKYLKPLEESRDKPKIRISKMNDCKYEFKQDIERYIGDLEFT